MSSEKLLALQFSYTNNTNTSCCPNTQFNSPTKEPDYLNSMVIFIAYNK